MHSISEPTNVTLTIRGFVVNDRNIDGELREKQKVHH